MTKQITSNHDVSAVQDINPNIYNIAISSKVNESNLSIPDYNNTDKGKQAADDANNMCSTLMSSKSGTNGDESVVVINAKNYGLSGSKNDKTVLVEVDQNGNSVSGTGSDVSGQIDDLKKQVSTLVGSLQSQTNDTGINQQLDTITTNINTLSSKVSSEKSTGSITNGFIYFLFTYIILSVIVSIIVIMKPPTNPSRILKICFPFLAYIIDYSSKLEIRSNELLSSTYRKIRPNINRIGSIENKLNQLINRSPEQEPLQEEQEVPVPAAAAPAPAPAPAAPAPIDELTTNQLADQLEAQSQTGGKRNKYKRKKIAYKRFRKSQI